MQPWPDGAQQIHEDQRDHRPVSRRQVKDGAASNRE
jgi:hypothetical protein